MRSCFLLFVLLGWSFAVAASEPQVVTIEAAWQEDPAPRPESAAEVDPPPEISDFILDDSADDLTYVPVANYFGCGPACGYWVNVDYLLWWTDPLSTPPLVSTSPSGTAQTAAGVLDQGGTVLFGGNLLRDVRSGGRVRFGKWFDAGRQFGVEGEYLGLGEINDHFDATSTGDPILARPFLNALTNQEDAELVSFPGVVSGTVTANAKGKFQSVGGRYLWNLCCNGDSVDGTPSHARLDLLAGYRFLRLDESLVMTENLTSQLPNDPGTFAITDRFRTFNQFHGGEIGLLRNETYGRWSLEMLAKIAMGNVWQKVAIDGSTAIDDGTGPQSFTGGLLAQRTNIGVHSRNRFALVPELGITLGYSPTDRLRATFGYTLIYWDRVVRAGDQIDRQVNPNLLPPEMVPLTGPLRPEFNFREDGFWAQGMNFGLSYVW